MASSTKISTGNPFAGVTVSEKLGKGNHAIWKAQVLAVIRGARLEDYLTGAEKAPDATITIKKDNKEVEVKNPEFEEWVATDQQVLGYLLSTMGRDVLAQVAMCRTSAAVWSIIEGMFFSVSKARSINTRIALATTKKGDLSITEYINKMRALADEMVSSGKPLDEEDLISYIFAYSLV